MTAMRSGPNMAELALQIILSYHTPTEGPKLPRGNGKEAPVPVCSACAGALDRVVWPCLTYTAAVEGLNPGIDIKKFCKDAVQEWSSTRETPEASELADWSMPKRHLNVVDGGRS